MKATFGSIEYDISYRIDHNNMPIMTLEVGPPKYNLIHTYSYVRDDSGQWRDSRELSTIKLNRLNIWLENTYFKLITDDMVEKDLLDG